MNPECRGHDACPNPRRCRPAILEFRDTAGHKPLGSVHGQNPHSVIARIGRVRPTGLVMTGGQRRMRSSGCGLRYSLSEVRNARLRFGRVEFRRARNQFRLGHYADRHEVAAVAVKVPSDPTAQRALAEAEQRHHLEAAKVNADPGAGKSMDRHPYRSVRILR
jgi:hypothetical protein